MRQFVRYLGVAAAATLAGLVLLEETVRFLGLNWQISGKRRDEAIGVHYAAGTVIRWGREGFGVTHYVADGEIATPFNEGMEIPVIGDSHTEAWQVDDGDKYVSVAEDLLWRHGHRVNLRNFGLAGLSFADYVYWAPELLKRNPPPQALVIQISDDDFDASFDDSAVNYFRWRADGSLELVHASPDSDPLAWKEPWWSRSRLITYVDERWRELHRRRSPPGAPKSAAEITASVAAQVRMLADRVGRLPIVFLRAPSWPYADEPDHPAMIMTHALRSSCDWPVLDPGTALVRQFTETHRDPRTFFNGLPMNGHLNREGNAVVGRVLAEGLERIFFVEQPSVTVPAP